MAPSLLLELVGAGHRHADGKSIGCQPSPFGVKVGQPLLDDDELLDSLALLELELLDAEHPSPACINWGSRLLYVKRCSNPDAGAASPSDGTFVPPVPAFVSSLTPLEVASAQVGHVSSGSHEQGLGVQEELLLDDDELLELELLDEELLDELLEEESPDELLEELLLEGVELLELLDDELELLEDDSSDELLEEELELLEEKSSDELLEDELLMTELRKMVHQINTKTLRPGNIALH